MSSLRLRRTASLSACGTGAEPDLLDQYLVGQLVLDESGALRLHEPEHGAGVPSAPPRARSRGVGRRWLLGAVAGAVGLAGSGALTGLGATLKQEVLIPLLAGTRWRQGPFPPAVMTGEDRADWEQFKARFLAPEGRIVDTGNKGVSHSEGQGWGLLLAEAFGDQPAFNRILRWTRANLQIRDDALHCWRYVPDAARPVPDQNNASDGDLFLATALLRGARRWNRPDLAEASAAIAWDVLRLLVRQVGDRTLLLPGAAGFEQEDAVTINPSYLIFPAFAELATVAPSPIWGALRQDGLDLISSGRFGRWGLPPDWLRVSRRDGTLSPAPGWPPRFSYDAVRVPLYLSWARAWPADVEQAFARYWTATHPASPAWVDLQTDATANYPASSGAASVAALMSATCADLPAFSLPRPRQADDYYAASLTMLARLAIAEITAAGPPAYSVAGRRSPNAPF